MLVLKRLFVSSYGSFIKALTLILFVYWWPGHPQLHQTWDMLLTEAVLLFKAIFQHLKTFGFFQDSFSEYPVLTATFTSERELDWYRVQICLWERNPSSLNNVRAVRKRCAVLESQAEDTDNLTFKWGNKSRCCAPLAAMLGFNLIFKKRAFKIQASLLMTVS